MESPSSMQVSIPLLSKCLPLHALQPLARTDFEHDSVVAVHGLGGDALKTWTSKSNKDPWLKDPAMLPRAMPQARILTWGYDAEVVDVMGGTSSDRILQHAQTLISQLHADRSVRAPCSSEFLTI